MSRIDANIATQAADVVRPRQSAREIQLQAEQDRSKKTKDAERDPDQKVESTDLRSATAQLQQVVEAAGVKQLAFGFGEHKESGDTFVVISDKDSGEVIRQIPGEEILALRDRIRELIGIMFDKQA